MLIRGIGGDRKVGASYLSRQECGGGETLEVNRKVSESFRKGSWLGCWGRGGKLSKLTSTNTERSVGVKTSPYTSCYVLLPSLKYSFFLSVCKILKMCVCMYWGRVLLRHLPLCPQHNQVRQYIPNQCLLSN